MVTPVNDPPTANNDTFSVAENSGATVLNVLANDTMVPDTGETLTVTAVTQPASGTVTFTGANVSFTPTADFSGPTTFTYTISDGNGGTATATVTVNVGSSNNPPTANDDSYGGRGQRTQRAERAGQRHLRPGRGRDADGDGGDSAGQRHGDASRRPT